MRGVYAPERLAVPAIPLLVAEAFSRFARQKLEKRNHGHRGSCVYQELLHIFADFKIRGPAQPGCTRPPARILQHSFSAEVGLREREFRLFNCLRHGRLSNIARGSRLGSLFPLWHGRGVDSFRLHARNRAPHDGHHAPLHCLEHAESGLLRHLSAMTVQLGATA